MRCFVNKRHLFVICIEQLEYELFFQWYGHKNNSTHPTNTYSAYPHTTFPLLYPSVSLCLLTEFLRNRRPAKFMEILSWIAWGQRLFSWKARERHSQTISLSIKFVCQMIWSKVGTHFNTVTSWNSKHEWSFHYCYWVKMGIVWGSISNRKEFIWIYLYPSLSR